MKRSLESMVDYLRTYGINLRFGKRLARAYYMAERNSAQRGIEFALSLQELAKLAQRSSGRCEMTGLGFEIVDTDRKGARQPWTPSIDRIDCTKGYTFGNCRIVCAAVNVALNAWGDEVLERIAEAILVRNLRHVEGYKEYLLGLDAKIKRQNRNLRKRWIV